MRTSTIGAARGAAAGLLFLALAAAAAAAAPPRPGLRFEENCGQTDPEARFLARGPGYTVFLTGDGMVWSLAGSPVPHRRHHGGRPRTWPGASSAGERQVLRLRLRGARPDAAMIGQAERTGKVSYFRGGGAPPITEVPTFERVEQRGVYPGIDLVYHAREGILEYDFEVAPGADPGRIGLDLTGARSARIDPGGDLVVELGEGDTVRQPRPRAYQEADGRRREVTARFVRRADGGFGFAIGPHDRRLALVIDPAVVYATYLGGSLDDYGLAVAVDPLGAAVVVGYSDSIDFPARGGGLPPAGRTDAFVAKLNPAGDDLVFSTYLGGSGNDIAYGVVLGPDGSAYVAGVTTSTDFPVPGAAQTLPGGLADSFIARISAAGGLLSATYLGGSDDDLVWGGIDLDDLGRVWVAGETLSTDLAVVSPLQAAPGGLSDGFVARLSAAGDRFEYLSYLGGSDDDRALDVAVDAGRSAYVTGGTYSTDFPVRRPALQGTNLGRGDAFVVKLDPAGASTAYATFLGGTDAEEAVGVAVDADSAAYVTGTTFSDDFPVAIAYQPVYQDIGDVFVAKLDPGGAALAYSTYLGGTFEDEAAGIAVDRDRQATVVAWTDSDDFPVAGGPQATNGGIFDAAVARIGRYGDRLLWSSYLGGGDWDDAYGIAVGGDGAVYLTGGTLSDDFPTVGGFQMTAPGPFDAWVAKLAGCSLPGVPAVVAELKLTRDRSDVVWRWTDRPEAQGYRVYEGDRPDLVPTRLTGTAASGAIGLSKPLPPDAILFFHVAGENPCGEGDR